MAEFYIGEGVKIQRSGGGLGIEPPVLNQTPSPNNLPFTR
jgi:hypothetical protein